MLWQTALSITVLLQAFEESLASTRELQTTVDGMRDAVRVLVQPSTPAS